MGVKTRLLATGASEDNEFNIGLLGFKMAVNEGLTVFNLVDGVVDEFNDESGTDEAEGSNDLYCGTSDYYINSTSPGGVSVCISAGFTTTAVTEPETSTAGTNPTQGSGTYGTFTVPGGVTSLNVYTWAAGGGGGAYPMAGPAPEQLSADGGGGGFSTGTLAVTGGQSFTTVVGEGGKGNTACFAGPSPGVLGGGGSFGPSTGSSCNPLKASGGGLSGMFVGCVSTCNVDLNSQATAPQAFIIAGAGGGGAYPGGGVPTESSGNGGAGGGTTGDAGGTQTEQTNNSSNGSQPESSAGGGGDQEQGGQGGVSNSGTAQTGLLFKGGSNGGAAPNAQYSGTGGGGYYGGGGGSYPAGPGAGGGGSSYISHPQITCGSTEEGAFSAGGGTADPNYVSGTNEGFNATPSSGTPTGGDTVTQAGEDGYVLITGAVCASVTSTTIVSTAFAATNPVSTARIVVFEENVDNPTLNTDIIASVSRDGGTTFTNATLIDSGYVTGSSGQRILTGQADISGQPSGQSMRWKLALANNTVKIHGVSLQWS